MKYTSWIITAVAVVGIIGAMVWYANLPGKYDTFASCIKDAGAKFYGAFWCPHCQDQKSLFGKSAKRLPYIECSLPNGSGQIKLCNDEGIESYPTWEFTSNGTTTRQKGNMSLTELAQATGCTLQADNI